MLPIQPRRLLRRDEELATVRVRPRIGHADRVRLVVFQRAELVLELAAPDGFAAGAVAERVAALNHELADDTVEDGVVVVAGFGVGDKVLDGFRGGFGEEAEVDVAVGGVQDGRGSGFVGLGVAFRPGVEVAGFFVLDVASGSSDFGFVGEDVEADFSASGSDEHGVAGFGFLEEGVGGGGHGGGHNGFLLGRALVEGEVEGAEGLVFAVDLDDAVGVGVDDFCAEDGAVDDEVAGFVEDDVDFVL